MSEIISLKKGETISLSKSPVIDLTKGGKGLSFVTVGLGWDPVKKTKTEEKKGGFFSRLFGSETSGSGYSEDIDCDAFVIEKKDGRDVETVFFGNLSNKNQSIKHTGDNLTGEGEGDDESILIDLSACLSDEIVIGVNIYRGDVRGQDFSMLENAYVRIVDNNTNKEMCRFTLDSTYEGYITIIFGVLRNVNSEWTFEAVGMGSEAKSIGAVVWP